MAKWDLMASQRNEVLESIKYYGLEPFNFEWGTSLSSRIDKLYVPVLRFKNSDFFFKFDCELGRHYAVYSPGEEKITDYFNTDSWHHQRNCCDSWLSYLKREITAPDLWSEVAKYQIPSGMEVKPDILNEQFTIPQVERIVQGLQQIKDYLEKEKLISKEHREFVEEKLNYLAEAARRQGRKDWIHTAIGVLGTICVALTLSIEQGRTLFNILKGAVIGIIQFLPVK